jgi:transcription elongation GreA/GreB family factor
MTYTLVAESEADLKTAFQLPIGKGVIGKSVGNLQKCGNAF